MITKQLKVEPMEMPSLENLALNDENNGIKKDFIPKNTETTKQQPVLSVKKTHKKKKKKEIKTNKMIRKIFSHIKTKQSKKDCLKIGPENYDLWGFKNKKVKQIINLLDDKFITAAKKYIFTCRRETVLSKIN